MNGVSALSPLQPNYLPSSVQSRQTPPSHTTDGARQASKINKLAIKIIAAFVVLGGALGAILLKSAAPLLITGAGVIGLIALHRPIRRFFAKLFARAQSPIQTRFPSNSTSFRAHRTQRRNYYDIPEREPVGRERAPTSMNRLTCSPISSRTAPPLIVGYTDTPPAHIPPTTPREPVGRDRERREPEPTFTPVIPRSLPTTTEREAVGRDREMRQPPTPNLFSLRQPPRREELIEREPVGRREEVRQPQPTPMQRLASPLPSSQQREAVGSRTPPVPSLTVPLIPSPSETTGAREPVGRRDDDEEKRRSKGKQTEREKVGRR